MTIQFPYTKRNIDRLEAVQRRAARLVLSFYDYHPPADLSGNNNNNNNGYL